MAEGYEEAIIKEEIQMTTKHGKALNFVTLGMVELTQGERRAEG